MSWLVYAVRSTLICLRSSTIMRAVDSLPLKWPVISRSRCLVQQMMVHMIRFGTLMATGCARLAKREANCRIVFWLPPASSGRISSALIFCRHFVS